nr:LD-carboxypeptidase [Nannocystis sp. SCPEA4]
MIAEEGRSLTCPPGTVAAVKAALVRPPPSGPSGRVVVAAPSGPVPEARLAEGLAVLRDLQIGEISLAPNLGARTGYFAGEDGVRLAALQAALDDPEVTAIVCARGGYGLTRLLPLLRPAGFVAAPKLLVGFSDATALLCWALRAGVCGVHGPVVTQLGALPAADVQRLALLMRGELPAPLTGDEGVGTTRVVAPLVPANLEVLRSLVGTPWLPDLAGTIVALEEIGERPYRIDRALTQLITSGAFAGVRGFAVGQLYACEEPPAGNPNSPNARAVVRERLAGLDVPVVLGLPFGHLPHEHAALPCGARVELDPSRATLTMLEPVTA